MPKGKVGALLCAHCGNELKGLSRLTPRQEKVLRLRNEGKTLEAIGNIYHISRERVRQIQAVALRKLESFSEF